MFYTILIMLKDSKMPRIPFRVSTGATDSQNISYGGVIIKTIPIKILIILQKCNFLAFWPSRSSWWYQNILKILHEYSPSTLYSRCSGHYAPFLLAPAEGWGPFRSLGPCGPRWEPPAPSRVAMSKPWTLNFENWKFLQLWSQFCAI